MTSPRRANGHRGQAAVELALILPLVVGLALVVVQVGLVVRDQVMVTHAAREAARAVSVESSPQAARDAAIRSGELSPDRLSVSVSGGGTSGSLVTVDIAYQSPTSVPFVGRFIGDVELTAAATMRVE